MRKDDLVFVTDGPPPGDKSQEGPDVRPLAQGAYSSSDCLSLSLAVSLFWLSVCESRGSQDGAERVEPKLQPAGRWAHPDLTD